MNKVKVKDLVFLALAALIVGALAYAIAFWIFNDDSRDALGTGITIATSCFIVELLRPYLERLSKKKKKRT